MLYLSVLTLIFWLYALLSKVRFWQIRTSPVPSPPAQEKNWPQIVAVIPARNEAETIASTLQSLLTQSYPGEFSVILVNDHSEDETVSNAEACARQLGKEKQLIILNAPELPPRWSGKVWAMQQGFLHCEKVHLRPQYILFTDADITHSEDSLHELACRAYRDKLSLVSFMVKLNCQSFAEKLMIPAFVYFFRMLYPFEKVNNPNSSIAAAAGGVMLVERAVLRKSQGLAKIHNALIDDCALAKVIQKEGSLWLGMTASTISSRQYSSFGEIWTMIARTAFFQLRNSFLRLMGCIVGMALIFIVPPALTLASSGIPQIIGALAWAMIAITYAPMLRFYKRSLLWAPFLPIIALLFLGATLDSARRHYLGHGGSWKGRAQG